MALTASQFGRAVQVEIVPPSGPGVLINPDTAPGATQLRVAVEVTKGIGTAATCVVDVTNLSKASRDRAAGVTRRVVDFSDEVGTLDGRLVFGDQFGNGKTEIVSRANGFGYIRVSAFYQGAGTTVALFEGTTKRVGPVRGKPTRVTRIEASDGVVQDAAAVANRQWRETTDAATVLEYVIRDVMGTNLVGSRPGNFAAGLPLKLQQTELVGGYDSTRLFATDILTEFASERVSNTVWWWDNGQIYWLEKGQGLNLPELLLDTKPASGSYQILDKPTLGEDNKLDVPLLLLPECVPGRICRILSGEFRGRYIASTVTHRCDNRGQSVSRTTVRLDRLGVLPFE